MTGIFSAVSARLRLLVTAALATPGEQCDPEALYRTVVEANAPRCARPAAVRARTLGLAACYIDLDRPPGRFAGVLAGPGPEPAQFIPRTALGGPDIPAASAFVFEARGGGLIVDLVSAADHPRQMRDQASRGRARMVVRTAPVLFGSRLVGIRLVKPNERSDSLELVATGDGFVPLREVLAREVRQS